jgi:CRISPR-associated protein Csm5
MAKKQYTVTITPLTGVHVGTGEALTPLDYKLAEKVGTVDFKKPMYWKFSSDKILRRLITEGKNLAAFEEASGKGEMKKLQQFFQTQCTEISDTEYPCNVTRGFVQLYNHNINEDPIKNAACVLQMYHPAASPKPVIPGSSLKGSIRTAFLNWAMNKTRENNEAFYESLKQENRERRLQESILKYSDAKNDPFRCVMLSDCAFSANAQLVGVLKNISVDNTGELTALDKLQIQAEVIRGTLLDGKASAETQIGIDTDLQKEPFTVNRNSEPQKISSISFQNIFNACNYFYKREFDKEYDWFYKDAVAGIDKIIKLKAQLEAAVKTPNQCIIRVGRWSQVEFVTLEEAFRNPKTPMRNGKKQGSGNTRTVFDYDGQYVPLGWCVLTVKES